jgi:hypothetical protein
LKALFVAFWAVGLFGGVDGPGKEVKNRVAAIAVKLVNRHTDPPLKVLIFSGPIRKYGGIQ